MSRKLFFVVSAFATLLIAIGVLGYRLYDERKWSRIYLEHMLELSREVDREHTFTIVDGKGDMYDLRVKRGEAKLVPSSTGIKIPNPLSPATSQAE
jgi:hypothetical protein